MDGSFKDFYDVSLKATYPINLGDRTIEVGEVIARFNNIQIAGLVENSKLIAASGGYGNVDRVIWNTIKNIPITLSVGTFSAEQFAILLNSNLIELDNSDVLLITYTEELETDEDNQITLKYTPLQDLFIYDKLTGEKITNYTCTNNVITLSSAFTEVIVNYMYNYNNNSKCIKIGSNLTDGFLQLEGKTRIKDNSSGEVVTGLFKIPKLRLTSQLTLRLGNNGVVTNGILYGECVPIGNRGNNYVTEFYFLDTYIDSDL